MWCFNMKKEKILILILVIVIIALVVGIIATMPNVTKQDTNLTFKSNSTLTEGDSIKIQLTDVNGAPLINQSVNITITNEDGSKDYHSSTTNSEGIASFKIDKKVGSYNVTLNYGGNDSYNACTLTQELKIEEVAEVEVSSSSSSSSSSQSQTYASGLTDDEIDAYIQRDLDKRAENGVSSSSYDYQEAREFYETVPPTGMGD